MIATHKFSFKGLLATAVMACTFAQTATAAQVAGVKFDDTTAVAGKELKLNGLGLRTKFFVKVYAAGLYLPEKKSALADIVRIEGPRRVQIVMMRDITSEDFAKAFMSALEDNTEPSERAKVSVQISKFNDMFGLIGGLKTGDVLHLDWIPGAGTQTELNGKKIGETVPDVAFYNAILRIWMGDKPVDGSLKPALLGAK